MSATGSSIQWSVREISDKGLAVLRVQGMLDLAARADFKAATAELLATDVARLVIDLSRIQQIASLFIGTLIDVANQATAAEKTLSIMVIPRLATVCEQAGLGKVAQIVEVNSA